MPSKNGKTPDPPTAGDIWGLYRQKEHDGNEGEIRRLVPLFRSLCKMSHAIDIPPQYKATTKEVRTPFVRDAWLRTTAALSRNDWLVHIDPKGPSGAAKRATGVAERWVKSAADRMNKEVGENTPYEAVKGLVRDSEAVIKTVHRGDAWGDFPRRTDEDAEAYLAKTVEYKKGSPLPFAWRNVDRLQMIFGDGEWGDTWAIEYGEYPQYDLKQKHGMEDDPSGRLRAPGRMSGRPAPEGYSVSSVGRSIKLEYFDADWWCCVIDGDMAPDFPKPNPYSPRLPYARARADADPEPILYSLLFLTPALDAVLTAWTNWLWLGMFPNPYLEDIPNSQALPAGLRPPTGDDAASAAFEWSPGKFLEIPRGKRFAFMSPPPVGADAKEMALILRSLIDIAGIPSILRGGSLAGDSGYLANQMISAAIMMYERAADALSRQIEKAIEFFLYLIPARIKQTVYVMGQGDSGRGYLGLREKGATTEWLASVDQLGDVTVTRRPDTSSMEQALALIARQLTEGPPDQRLISLRRAREKYLHEEDPDQVGDEIWVEHQIATNPDINAAVVGDALRQAGFYSQPTPNPATQLVGPDGVTPIASAPGPGGVPGNVAGGLPVMPGQGMPFAPPPPQGVTGAPGGRPAGAYPGRPGTPVAQ
jgi:hypothetical protein